MRQISVVVPETLSDELVSKLTLITEANVSVGCNEGGSRNVSIVVEASDSQESIDLIQSMLASRSGWQIRILPVEAVIHPKQAEADDASDEGKCPSSGILEPLAA